MIFETGIQIGNRIAVITQSNLSPGTPVVTLLKVRLVGSFQRLRRQTLYVLIAAGIVICIIWAGLIPGHAEGQIFILGQRGINGIGLIVSGRSILIILLVYQAGATIKPGIKQIIAG